MSRSGLGGQWSLDGVASPGETPGRITVPETEGWDLPRQVEGSGLPSPDSLSPDHGGVQVETFYTLFGEC